MTEKTPNYKADQAIERLEESKGYEPLGACKSQFEIFLEEELNLVKKVLVEKNRKYGNSALEPQRVFSKASPLEQINVRIDDKLSRIANQQKDEDEDAEFDLLGYLLLKMVAKRYV